MNDPITRRTALKLIATATVVGAASGPKTGAAATTSTRAPDAQPAEAWSRTHDRVWLGGDNSVTACGPSARPPSPTVTRAVQVAIGVIAERP